jgi:GNAT superfamily N-acetyltransferase
MTAVEAGFTIRKAILQDVPALETLIQESVRTLQAADYTLEQRELALRTVYGVDTQLIRDGTYFVVEAETLIVACGGWSRRKTLYGGDRHAVREDSLLDSSSEAARIRAFFIRPGWERRGIGSALVFACEQAAVVEGFRRMEMGSTLTGVALYRAHGYVEIEQIEVPLRDGLTLPVVRMGKSLTLPKPVAD